MKTTLIISIVSVLLICGVVFGFADVYVDHAKSRLNDFADKLRGALHSKTVWFNTLALVFLQQLPSLVDYLAQNAPALQPFIPANHYQFVIGAITIANLILRYKTTQPLEAK